MSPSILETLKKVQIKEKQKSHLYFETKVQELFWKNQTD
jgi:hypothetical protein